jgi:predicted mannosyl-3-phosphoglycerate phosphatase (HAD superfamily)
MLNSPSITPVIFTDLDGSLLDHYTYSFAAATPLLDELNSQEIPVIPITSKTYAEVIRLRRFMGNSPPFYYRKWCCPIYTQRLFQ